MEMPQIVTLIGIILTFVISLWNLIYSKRRNKQADYLSLVTDYRLKWIDLARTAIGEYLLSVDKLSGGEDSTLEKDYAFFLEKHWKMQSFLNTFSKGEQKANETLTYFYKSASELFDPNCGNRQTIRDNLRQQLDDADIILRKLMDDNWSKVKYEVFK